MNGQFIFVLSLLATVLLSANAEFNSGTHFEQQLHALIMQLQVKVSDHEARIAQLEANEGNASVTELEVLIDQLTVQNEIHMANLARLEAELAQQEANNINQDSSIAINMGRIADLQDQQSGTYVAFTAVAHVATIHSYPSGSVIQFETTYVNIGGHYNAGTGIFTCPVTGLYAFYHSGRTGTIDRALATQIVLNNQALTCAVSGDERRQSGSAMIVVECRQGQRVWVKSSWHTNYVQSDPLGFTSFSGFLIRKA